MESTVRRMKRTAGVNSLIWSFAVLILVRGVAAIDFTRNEDSLGNLDIYEVKALLEEMSTTIAVGIVLDNRSPYKLALEEEEVTCGYYSVNSSFPEFLLPGQASLTVMEKKVALLRGVCGAVRYSVVPPPPHSASHIHYPGTVHAPPPPMGTNVLAMWSQPYDLNLYRGYSAAGVSWTPLGEEGLFSSLYYKTGDWNRAEAGLAATFNAGGVGVMTSFTAGTYKPVVVVTITEGSHPAVVARLPSPQSLEESALPLSPDPAAQSNVARLTTIALPILLVALLSRVL